MDKWQWGGSGIAVIGICLPMTGLVSHAMGWAGVGIGALMIAAPFVYHRIAEGSAARPNETKHDLRTAKPPNIVTVKPRFVPLPEAAVRVLDATLDNLIGEMAMSEPTEDDRLNWFGWWIHETRGVPIYGRRPPATKRELIEGITGLRFVAGAKELHENWGSRRLVWTDLVVKSSDLEAHWASLIK